ncbi:MAG: DUF1489 domain-containing protein [Alphaproteobacteria bacterium]|nr:DUF1489 domain-containing protein [Alphaproteobacteria bacterium]NNF24323.1 DUF1489 domain-containing protein [Paracoccaceae bacterium]
MDKTVHLLKLSVGTQSVEGLQSWQSSARAKGPDGLPRHVTRMWPRREPEILNGGSIFWVIKGVILCRQRIVRLDEVRGSDGIARCGIVLDPKLVRTEAAPRRPFQGWRYLPVADAPRDLGKRAKGHEDLPPQLVAALAEIGVR